ncbi:MAG: hypothetical protein QOH39_2718 [Verrucomicrobiota bacterium]|jgi:predicted nuclease of predicted toxin-antitoxin system
MTEAPSFFAELKRRNVYKVAVAYAVVAWQERACEEHSAQLYTFACFPDYCSLHSDSHFADLARRIGIDPRVLSRQEHP